MDTVPGWYSPAEDESPDWGPCPTCGTANAATARFCQACGRPLGDPGPDPMTIDVLTAVVAELVSANDAFALAPDADDRLVTVRDTLVASGAVLRDLPGSPHTVAGVFGPAARDGISTLTAVRAALAARDTATGGDIALRLGVGASDVRGDDDEAVELWRGRVTDLALRLSRMAAPAEVILGEGAYRLIRDAVLAEAIDPRADPDGDNMGPLRLQGLREMDAWAVQPERTQTDLADGSPSGAASPSSGSTDRAKTGPAWDMWAERFRTATENGHQGPAPEPADERPAAPLADPSPRAGTPDAFEATTPEEVGASDLAYDEPVWDAPASTEATPPAEPVEPVEAVGQIEPVDAARPADEVAPAGAAGAEPVDAVTTPAIEHLDMLEPVETPAPELAARVETPVETRVETPVETPVEPGTAPHEPEGATLLEREAVLGQLHDALDRAIERRHPVTVAIGGQPGCGRTAAARWFAAQTTDRAWTVEIACRPADAGGTSWPFAALVRSVTGIDGPIERRDLEARLGDALTPDTLAAAGVLAASLEGEGGARPEETRAAIAALLTATIARRPLIVIVDDADRASAASRATFDSIVELVEGPLLVVVIGHGSAGVIVPPLSDHASEELVERLLARPNLPPDATSSIVTACGGLPLAVEHLVAMLADDGHLRWEYGRWTPTVDLASLPLPADLSSLVARRVGGLGPVERRVAAATAVAGDAVDPGLVASALNAESEEILDACTSLADRGILRRVEEDAFAFGHDVLAEAAAVYAERESARAMHLATAETLERDRAPGSDVDEAIGAHLERAFRLTGGHPTREALGRRAAEHLARAARGAADVGDEDASLTLLRRAAAVLPSDDVERALLLLDSAAMLAARDERASAERLLGDAIRAARAAGDDLLELRALVARARMLATASRIEDQIEALRDAADAAIATATAREDSITATAGWSARGWVYVVRGHFAGAADAFEHAADTAVEAGRRRDELSALRDLTAAIVDGPAPVAEGIARCTALVERTRGTAIEADTSSALAVLLARAGRTDEAARTLNRVAELHAEDEPSTTIGIRAALVALNAGAADRAEAPLRAALETAARATDRGAVLSWLAYVLTELGRREEALAAADGASSQADDDDVVSQVTWRAAQARCLATGGSQAQARLVVRFALRLADQTDLSELRARTRLDLADVLLASGRANEAAPAARAALRALERKGSVAEAVRARSILDRAAGRAPVTAEPDGPDESSNDAPTLRSDAASESADPHRDDPLAPFLGPTGGNPSTQPDEPSGAEESEGAKRERHWFW